MHFQRTQVYTIKQGESDPEVIIPGGVLSFFLHT